MLDDLGGRLRGLVSLNHSSDPGRLRLLIQSQVNVTSELFSIHHHLLMSLPEGFF